MAREAERFSGRKTVDEWAQITLNTFNALGMLSAMQEDVAGSQVLGMVESLAAECEAIENLFSLAEWRALLNLQLEQAEFVAPRIDQRVRMVPLKNPPSLDVALLSELVQVAFSQRRKLLRHTLGRWLDARAFAGAFDVQRRAEEVPVADYVQLVMQLDASNKKPAE